MSEKEEVKVLQNSDQSTLSYKKKYHFILPTGEELHVEKDWTDAEEDSVRWKIDFLLLPVLIAGFFVLQLDRSNLSNALTSTFMKDLNLSSFQVNVGNQLLSVGIVLGEIPSNYVLQKIGPSMWLPYQIVVWGSIALSQGFIKNYAGYLVTRILLGFGESGFIPGGLYTLSKFYKQTELGRRHTIYFLGNVGASCLGGLIAGGILLDLTDKKGWPGWKWLFFIEGLVTIFVGLVTFVFLPQSTLKTSPFWTRKINFFDERERHIMTQRLLIDDPIKALDLKGNVSWKDVKNALSKWRIYLHFTISMLALSPTSPLGTYLPTIVKKMGYTQFKANAMSTVPYWIMAVFIIVFGQVQDRFKPRASVIIILGLLDAIWCIVLRATTTHLGNHARYALLVLALAFATPIHVLNTSWISVNARRPTDRASALAIVVIAANCAGIYGSQILNTDDAPYYKKEFTILSVLQSLTFLFSVITYLQYVYSNKRLDKKYGKVEDIIKEGKDEEKEVSDNSDNSSVFYDYTKIEKDEDLHLKTFRYKP